MKNKSYKKILALTLAAALVGGNAEQHLLQKVQPIQG